MLEIVSFEIGILGRCDVESKVADMKIPKWPIKTSGHFLPSNGQFLLNIGQFRPQIGHYRLKIAGHFDLTSAIFLSMSIMCDPYTILAL